MSASGAINAQFSGLLPGLLGIELQEATAERVGARLRVRPELCTSCARSAASCTAAR